MHRRSFLTKIIKISQSFFSYSCISNGGTLSNPWTASRCESALFLAKPERGGNAVAHEVRKRVIVAQTMIRSS